MTRSLKDYMPKMGTGPRSSDPLTYEEARGAMSSILDDGTPPASFGAFVVAERWKGQEPEELAGFLDELRSRNDYFIHPSRTDHVDIAGRFDGKEKSINTDLPSSILSSACGLAVFTHAGQNVPTQEATTLIDIVEKLGWDPRPSAEQVAETLDEIGFAYAHQVQYAPYLARLRDRRADLGVRCFLNTIESMMNPTNATTHVGSFYHLSFAKRVCDTFRQLETPAPDRIIMIQGIEGQTEFRPGTSVLGIQDGDTFDDREIRTGEIGDNFTRNELETEGGSAKKSAQALQQFFRGNSISRAYKSSVLLNSAVKLWAGRVCETIEEGHEIAESALDSGKARDFFQTLEEVYSHEREKAL